MSGVSYDSFVSSKPFTVKGPGNKDFYVHAELLAQSSAVFKSAVHGDMQEKRLEKIEIKDVDKDIDDDTVAHFIEYIYRGDYTVPDPDVVQLQTDPIELQSAFTFRSPGKEDNWDGSVSIFSKKDKKNRKKSFMWSEEQEVEAEEIAQSPVEVDPAPTLRSIDKKRSTLWRSFCAQTYTVPRPPWKPRGNNDEREDYSGVFLCHARLYKFADRYGCAELTSLTLQKLQMTLSKYVLHDARVGDIIELVRYTYAHTIDSDPAQNRSKPDALRVLVLDYLACHLPQLERNPSCHQLLQEGGSLPSELFTRAVQLIA